jgi:phosphoglycerate dehydrogenase-like enzyme
MSNNKKIVFLYSGSHVPDVIIESAKSKVPDGFSLIFCENKTPDAQRRAALADADYVMAYAVGFEDFDVVGQARLFQLLSAGYDRFDLNEFSKLDLPIATNGGANAPTVAEHALLLILAVYKKLGMHDRTMRGGEWVGMREALSMRELRGKQVGIVGFGKIGRLLAEMVGGFRTNVVYYDVQAAPAEIERELNAKRVELDELMATSDVISLHTPLNDATRGMIGAQTLARMKSTAIIINTGRGPVVNEAALYEGLRDGAIAGAGLDVFESEPLAADSPLLTLDNIVVTPHIAGTTLDTWTRRLDFAFGNFQRVDGGAPAESLIPA